MARPSGPIWAVSPGASWAGWARRRVGAGVVLAGQRAQGVDVGGVHDAVDGAVLRGLELLDRLLRGGAELAVDADLEAGSREEVLKDADVVAAHPALDGDAVAEAVVRAVVVGVVGEAAVGVGARAAQRALEGLDGARADGAAGLQARGALEALDRPQGPGAEVAVHLHLEAGLPERLLELAHIGSRGAGAQRAVAEMRRLGRPARERARRSDDGYAKGEHGNDRNQRTAVGRRHDAKDPSFSLAPTGLAVGLARKRPRYVALMATIRPMPPKWLLGPPLSAVARQRFGWSKRPGQSSG